MLLVLSISITAAQKLQAQTKVVCDCTTENGKNVLVVTGSVSLTQKTMLGKKVLKHTYTPRVQIVNKSSCTMQVLGFTVSNGTTNPKMTILPRGADQEFSKPITAVKPAAVTNEGTNKIIKVTVRYTLNGRPCSQVVELLYYDDTVTK